MNLKAASGEDAPHKEPQPSLQLEGDERFDELLMKQSRDRSLGKRERTRALVLAHVASQLLADPARWPSVETVLSETGLSRGTFYNHFTDMNECVQVLLSTFFQSLWKPRSFSVSSHKEPVDPVYEANLWYCIAYEVNAGLFAAFSQVAASTPSLLRMREDINAQWVARVVASSSRRRGRPYTRQEAHAFRGELRMLISMSIETLRERNVHRDAMLLASYPDVESLAKAITTMWHRTIRHYEGEKAPLAKTRARTCSPHSES